MNETIFNLIKRQSCKSYSDEVISNDDLNLILEAGEHAPCGMGRQSPIFVVIKNKDEIEKLSKLNASIMNRDGVDPFYGATTLIIVFADSNISTYIEDGSLAIGNMLNAAYSLGIDSCWIHRAKESFQTEIGKEYLKKWGIAENYVGIGNVILGYRSIDLPPKKLRKEDYIKFIEE